MLFILCPLLSLGFSAAQEPEEHPCPQESCCNTTLMGKLTLMYCRDSSDTYSLSEIAPPPEVLNNTNTRPLLPKELLESSEVFTLRLLDLNVFGVKFESETVAVRMEAIKSLLEKSLYDLVLIQEAWYNEDYRILASAFPHATKYGTPGSTLCPPVTRDQAYKLQLFPGDCTGLMLLSRWPITSEEMMVFAKRIPWFHSNDSAPEIVIQRGAIDATIKVSKVVLGEVKEVEVGVVNTHLATWYSETEAKWSQVREAQAEQVLDLSRTVAKKVDLLIVGGDLNSSPASKVYSKFLGEGLTEIELGKSREPRFHTWGHEKNTWTSDEDGYRIDYLFYKPQGNRLSNVRTSMFSILDAKTEEGMSLSDHMGVETNLEITFTTR